MVVFITACHGSVVSRECSKLVSKLLVGIDYTRGCVDVETQFESQTKTDTINIRPFVLDQYKEIGSSSFQFAVVDKLQLCILRLFTITSFER